MDSPQTARGFRPESLASAASVMATDRVASLIPRGAGQSCGDAALNPGSGVLHTQRLNRMLGFDPAEAILHVEAGVTFDEILTTFLPRGFLPAAMPMTTRATVGGAVATDAFGVNQHLDGSVGEQVTELSVMGADGRLKVCSRSVEPELFQATLGGLGLTGLVTDVKLSMSRVPSAYVDAEIQWTHDLDDLLDLFESHYIHRRYAVGWLEIGPSLGSKGSSGSKVAKPSKTREGTGLPTGTANPTTGVILWGEPAPLDLLSDQVRDQPHRWPELDASQGVVGRLRGRSGTRAESMQTRWGKSGRRVLSAPGFLAMRDGAFDLDTSFGGSGYCAFEAVIPFASGRDGIRSILDRLAAIRRPLPPVMMKPMGLSSPALLSLACPGWYLGFALPQYSGCDRELDRLQQMVVDHGGRRSLSSDQTMSLDHLTAMYPEWSRFCEVRERLDPESRFASAFSRRAEVG